MRKLSKEELIAHREALATRVAVSPVAEVVAEVVVEEVAPVAEVATEEVAAEDKPKRKSKKNDTEVAGEEHTHDENCEHSEEV
jgi:hypothetical protein